MYSDRLTTVSLRDPRILRILGCALEAVEPSKLVRRYLASTALPAHSRCFLLGLGKAAEAMTRGAAEVLGEFEAALVITKRKSSMALERFTVLEAGHPVPDERSIAAGQAALQFVSKLEPQDLLVCLISGGGSALVTAPISGVSLEDMQNLTADALNSGADIEDVNNLRRCLDRLKGGGLVAATRAQVLGVILSDVIGDPLDAIASGPTVPSRADVTKATELLARLRSGPSRRLGRILKPSPAHQRESALDRVTNTFVGNARTAAAGACQQARREGFTAEVLDAAFVGEARLVGNALGRRLATESRTWERPACRIAVGETTVALGTPHGSGGRNQELALAAVEPLDAVEDCMLIAVATDGEDGPTDAAGAVVTGTTAERARALRMIPNDFLERHDSNRFFSALSDLLKPGPTGTNVNDMVLMLAL